MKILFIIICFVAAIRLIKWLVRKVEKFKPKLVLEDLTLEEKLQQLAKVGIKLLPGFSTDYLLSKFERADYEKPGFDLLLSVIGGDDEGESFQHVSNCLYFFDMECIEDQGSYVTQIKRIAAITGGFLNISKATDFVNFEKEKAWAEFECNGKKVHINVQFDGDWFDPEVVMCLIDLANREGSGKKLCLFEIDFGQCLLIGYLSPSSVQRLAHLGISIS